MKLTQKLKVQAAIGLIVSFGALALSAPAAHAAPPCNPDSCQGASETTCTNCPRRSSGPGYNCSGTVSYVSPSTYNPYVCKDCNGDCTATKRREVYTNKECTLTCYFSDDTSTTDTFGCGQKIAVQYHPNNDCPARTPN